MTLTEAGPHRTYLTATDLACRAVLQKSSTCSGGAVGLQAGAEGHLGPNQLRQRQLLLFSLPLLLLILQKLLW